jgi:hypothetical protein
MLSFLSPFGKKQISSTTSSTSRSGARAARRKGRSTGMSASAFFDAVSRFDGRD